MSWILAETNTHQDHVIAHVIGATPLGHFIFDETAYLLLDIGFIWNIYLNMEMGLLPHPVAIAELEAENKIKTELGMDVDLLLQGKGEENLLQMRPFQDPALIQSVEIYESEDARRMVLICEQDTVVIETSLTTGKIRIS